MKFDSEDENFKTWLQEPTPIVWLHLTLSVTSIKAPDTSGMDALFPKPGVPVMLGSQHHWIFQCLGTLLPWNIRNFWLFLL